MATERVVDLGWMFKARLPVVPNFIISDDCGTSLPVQAFTDEALRKIGAAWTEALIAKAAERRKGA